MSTRVTPLPAARWAARWAACLLSALAMSWTAMPIAAAKQPPAKPPKTKTKTKTKTKIAVFPLSGTVKGPLADSPAKLTAVVVAETKQRSADVTVTQATFDDTAVLIGCDPEAARCHKQILKQLKRDEAIFGEIKVSRDARGTGVTVTLTRIRRNAKPVTQSFSVTANTSDRASKEFARLVPAFFGDTAPPETKIDNGSTDSSFSFGRVKRSTWAIVGGGSVLALTGILLWGLASGTQSDIDDAPTSTAAELDRLQNLEDSASTQAWAGNVFVVIGLATAGYGTYLLRKQGRALSPESASKPRVAPMPVKGGLGVMFTIGWPQ